MTVSDVWLSGYLPIQAQIYSPLADDGARGFIAPMIAECRDRGVARSAFFIRYSENGPHLRLRLRVSNKEAGEVRALVEQRWADWSGLNPAISRQSTVYWVDYVPEFDRYGGPDAMPAIEQFFDVSSAVVLDALTPAVSAQRPVRLGRAMLAMLEAFYVFSPSRQGVRSFARAFSRGYLFSLVAGQEQRRAFERALHDAATLGATELRPYLETALEQLLDEESLIPCLDPYRTGLVELRSKLSELAQDGRVTAHSRPLPSWEAVAGIVGPSLVHMTNNRLGVSIPEEAYLAHTMDVVFDDLN